MRRGAPQLGFPFGARLAPRGILSDSPFNYLGLAVEEQDRQGRRKMAGKTQTIEVKVDERLAAEIAGKAVHGWHATNYSNGKRRVYVTFEEVRTVGA